MIDPLLELQELDLSILRMGSRRDVLRSGEEIRTTKARLGADEDRLGELQLQADTVAADQKRLEYDVDALSQKAAAEERRLYDGSVANAKELGSIQHEIENLKERRGRLEDELLEKMERREDLDGAIEAANAAVAEGREALARLSADAERELEEIEARLGTAAGDRERLAASVDADLLELYDDLRAQKKGVGAAALVDGICQGCHEKLSAMELDKLKKTDGVKRCDYCRRILIIV